MQRRCAIARWVFCLLAVLPAVGDAREPRETPAIIISRIPRQPVHSVGLAAVGYSKRLRALEVEFINGAIYRYLDVPRSVHRDLMSAESKARFYDTNIRGKYRSLHVRQRASDY